MIVASTCWLSRARDMSRIPSPISQRPTIHTAIAPRILRPNCVIRAMAVATAAFTSRFGFISRALPRRETVAWRLSHIFAAQQEQKRAQWTSGEPLGRRQWAGRGRSSRRRLRRQWIDGVAWIAWAALAGAAACRAPERTAGAGLGHPRPVRARADAARTEPDDAPARRPDRRLAPRPDDPARHPLRHAEQLHRRRRLPGCALSAAPRGGREAHPGAERAARRRP